MSDNRCPDFTQVQTGVGVLQVPSRLAGQMHLLYHNGRGRTHPCGSLSRQPAGNLIRPHTPRPIQRHHPPPQKRSPPPLPPPSDNLQAMIKQWERLLTWATLKTLQDFGVMPARPAREASRRLAKRILADYGPSLHKWLGPRTLESTTSGGNTT